MISTRVRGGSGPTSRRSPWCAASAGQAAAELGRVRRLHDEAVASARVRDLGQGLRGGEEAKAGALGVGECCHDGVPPPEPEPAVAAALAALAASTMRGASPAVALAGAVVGALTGVAGA